MNFYLLIQLLKHFVYCDRYTKKFLQLIQGE